MRKYKIGDKIKLKPFDEKFRFSEGDSPWVVEDMIKHFGKEQEISFIYKTYFTIKGDGYVWSWCYSWIEPEFSLPDELFKMEL